MDLINEEDLLVLHVGDDRREVAFDLQQWSGGLLKIHSEFVGNDVGERGLPQTRGPVEQHVIHGLAT